MSQAGQYSEGLILGSLDSLTGNTGGVVGPDGLFNINIVGTGDVTVAGNLVANTLTILLSDELANQYDTDAGSAVPSGSILNVLGGTLINTAGATDTVTINADDSVAASFVTDAGTATPAANALTIIGGTNVTTSGAGSTVTINAASDLDINYTAVNTTPYVVLATDQFLGVDSSGGAIQVNLPNAPATGRVFHIKDSTGSAATNNITVTTVGGVVTIDGATTFVMNTEYQSINVIFNNTSYEIY